MKILQLVYKLSSGGAERFSVDLCNALADKGEEVVLCVIRDLEIAENAFYLDDLSSNVRVINLKIGPGISLRYLLEVRKVIAIEKPDVVHIHLDMYKYILPIPLLDRRRLYFQTIHNDIASINSRIERNLSRLLFWLKRVYPVTISNETTNSFVKAWRFPPFAQVVNGRACTGPTGKFASVQKEVESLKPRSETLVFLHVGRFSRQKNQALLVESFNRMCDQFGDAILIVIGAGFDSPNAESLKSLARNNVKFLGEKRNVTDYFMVSDAFCLSSIYEGMPISLIEAYCYGCTPICTPVGGIVDFVTNGETGYLSTGVSVDEYTKALLCYAKIGKQHSREMLKKVYMTHFSMGACADGYILAYHNASHKAGNKNG